MSEGGEPRRPAARNGFVRATGEIVLWWLFTYAVWLATLTSITHIALVESAAGTLPCAVLARLARQANAGDWRFRAGWLAWAAFVVRDVPVQTVQAWLYALIPRRRHAVITAVPLPAEDERAAAGRRATAVLSFATTPGTVVCDCDPDNGTVVLHKLRPEQGRLESAVQR